MMAEVWYGLSEVVLLAKWIPYIIKVEFQYAFFVSITSS